MSTTSTLETGTRGTSTTLELSSREAMAAPRPPRSTRVRRPRARGVVVPAQLSGQRQRLVASPARSCRPDAVRAVGGDVQAVRPRRGVDEAGLRLTRRGQAVLIAVVLVLTLATVTVARSTAATSGPVPAPVVYETLVVEPGQSLWEIARAASPEVDARSMINRIVDLNRLPADGSVRAGQQVIVPVSR